ncbi:MAG: trypsin-like peptidase domain-containing protein [Anaerolineae bacterium]|nr:trypsin-like peptidase domain-containing protein [Anaerolineae bacterium]
MITFKQRLGWMLGGAALFAALLLGLNLLLPGSTVAPVGAQDSVSFTELETRFIDLYDQASSAIVSIQVVEEGGFGQGSGFVFDTAGHIVTNEHVAGDAIGITVIFENGAQVEGELIGADPDSDLAVIKVDPAEAPALDPLPLGDSDALEVGQMVVAIGNPFGLSGTMTTGIVSALGRSLPANSTTMDGSNFTTPDIIQTDAAINPGNSGGPLLNLAGEVVGVNTAIRTQSGNNSGIGFAVPARIVNRVVPSLVESGNFDHPWLGIAGRSMDPITAELMGMDRAQTGILVASISSNSPALRAGLEGNDREVEYEGQAVAVGGDVIISANGISLTVFDDLVHFLSAETEVGQTITLGVLRNGKEITLDVTLAARPR